MLAVSKYLFEDLSLISLLADHRDLELGDAVIEDLLALVMVILLLPQLG